MKLLTTSGLLFATAANASNADGNYGAYPMIDWAAVFEEKYMRCTGALITTTPCGGFANSATSYNKVGLAPAVTALLTAYDGGKYVVGYGKYDGFSTYGWVMKLWGITGTNTLCNVGQLKPTGY